MCVCACVREREKRSRVLCLNLSLAAVHSAAAFSEANEGSSAGSVSDDSCLHE